jgi:hypothetical protein
MVREIEEASMQKVRSFNRTVAERIGAVSDRGTRLDCFGRLDATVSKFASFVVAWELTPVISAACCGPLKDKDLS